MAIYQNTLLFSICSYSIHGQMYFKLFQNQHVYMIFVCSMYECMYVCTCTHVAQVSKCPVHKNYSRQWNIPWYNATCRFRHLSTLLYGPPQATPYIFAFQLPVCYAQYICISYDIPTCSHAYLQQYIFIIIYVAPKCWLIFNRREIEIGYGFKQKNFAKCNICSENSFKPEKDAKNNSGEGRGGARVST